MKNISIILLFLTSLFLSSCGEISEGPAHKNQINEEGSGKLKWKKVLTLKGNSSKKSKVFKITGKEWKISWKTNPKNKDGEFIVILKDKKNKASSDMVANLTGDDEDVRYMTGSGSYYLNIKSDQNYEITVEDFI